LLRRRIVKKPSKLTIGIAAAGIGVVAASSALAATWPAGVSAGAATAADFLPVSHVANTADSGRFDRHLQAVKFRSAWQAELAAASAQRAAAARKAAARKAAAARAAARRAAELAAQQQAARQAAQQQAPARQAPAPPPPAQPSGSAQQIAMAMLGSFGWSSGQFSCLDSLWTRESGWSVTASNPDGAYGIPQADPGSKMASAGPDWQTNAATQVRWGLGYIKGMYGSPCAAWSHELATGWY
jgi:hypothetical protein